MRRGTLLRSFKYRNLVSSRRQSSRLGISPADGARHFTGKPFGDRLLDSLLSSGVPPQHADSFRAAARMLDHITRLHYMRVEEELTNDFNVCDPRRQVTIGAE